MGSATGRRRAAATVGLAIVVALVGSMVSIVGVPTPRTASAATVPFGTIRAQMANHVGRDYGTTGNCIHYAPTNTATSSQLVSSPSEALTAHGYNNNCPNNLNTNSQSAVGFRPGTATTVEDSTPFLIGRMVHYNNPITANDRYFTGTMNIVFSGFAATTIGFPWTLDETPNTGGGVNDEIAFSSQVSDVTLTQGGLTFRLVVNGFIPTGTGTTCPASPVGTPQNVFSTVEGQQTHACLYGTIAQARTLTVVKNVVGSPPVSRTFGFTSTSALAGSPWSNGAFTLGAGGTLTRDVVSSNTLTVTETDPNDDRWTLTNLVCTELNAAGVAQPMRNATVNLAARQVALSNIPPPLNATNPGITCTYTNTYTPRATLTLVKQVQSGGAAPNLWTLTATGSVAPPPSGTVISGPSGSAAVTSQRVPAGAYALTETGTGAASTGYVQVGNWACTTTGGATVPVVNGTVTLADSAAATASANVTCRVTNRLSTGSLQINKVVNAPAGAYTGGTTKTFSGTYNCGTGFTGTYTTLTTATPVVIANIPSGRTCTVTENPPSGGLANASYAWDTPSFTAQPVTISDLGTAAVTITNPVVQRFGTFALTKVVDGPGGYIGGTTRVFPVAYNCTLTNGPTTSGTVNLTLSQAVSPTVAIPAGSVCSFTETLVAQTGDFADPSYVWTGSAVSPTTLTIGDDTTGTATVTNSYTRQLGSLVINKVVSGSGYVGGGGQNFSVRYDCGPDFTGIVSVAAGGSSTVGFLPARLTCSVQELPLNPALLAAAYEWGTPTWAPGPTVTIPANGSATVTVTNPTVPIFGRVTVTKAVTGETQGVAGGATFAIVATCSNGDTYPFNVSDGGTATTPDLPVGTTCTITESAPSGGLVDGSFDWGPAPPAQTVTITASGQVVPVTMTNTVVRVLGQLTIAKAAIVPAGIVDPARVYTIDYSCQYGNDPAVIGQVTVTAGGPAATTTPVLGESRCNIAEHPASLGAPPSATDPSWVWLPVIISPSDSMIVAPGAPAAVTVNNSIRQLTSGFNVTKAVVGAGADGGYTPGATFSFTYSCTNGTAGSFAIADGGSFPVSSIPAFTTCTVTETAQPPTTPAYGWDPVEFTASVAFIQAGASVTFAIPDDPAGAQVNATNPITPRLSSVRVTKQVTGLIAGLDPAAPPFSVTLSCDQSGTFALDVPAGGSATESGIPVGAVCTATEAPPSGGLVDASYAWGPPSLVPANGTVTVAGGSTVEVQVSNPIVRVTSPVRLVKDYVGPQGIVDPARTYPVTWQCTYRSTQVAGGLVNIAADPGGVQVAAAVPVTSGCNATEGDLGTPSTDPAFRWLPPTITGTTVTPDGANTITVVNSLTRDSGLVLVRKQVTGEVEGYVNRGSGAEDFTLHGTCAVPADPSIPRRFADGVIADGGEPTEVPIVASIGWTCSGYEDTPGQELLRDVSYAWGPAILDPPGTFVLTRANPTQVFLAQNPIVRVRSMFSITKELLDPNGIVDPSAVFTGTYSCQYGTDAPVTGPWTLAAGETVTVPDILLTSVCSVTEDPLGATGLPDGSWAWLPPTISAPVTVAAGGSATVTVTNSVQRLYGGLQVTKTVVDSDGGVTPGAQFGGVWTCSLGTATFSDRFVVPADGTTVLFDPADRRVPATAECTIIEDTLADANLVDGSFDWDEPTYVPADATVPLPAGGTATVGITNTVIRVYSDVTVRKVITGLPAGLIPADREFAGIITCQYADDPPVVTSWSASVNTPALLAGVLVESVCSATEDGPGGTGQPVPGDPSYIWLEPIIGGPVVVTDPVEPTPPIVVTNPTDRLFGTFSATKTVGGAVEGIVDPTSPYVMNWVCVDGTGNEYSGRLEVPFGGTRAVGPEEQVPTASECTLNEPAAEMPELRDGAWQWLDPTFTLDGEPAVGDGRVLRFVIPTPQEDEPEPNVSVGVTNLVSRTPGAFTVAKTSDPPPGSIVQPAAAIAYSVTVTSNGTVPVHDVVVDDDLAGVLSNAGVVDGSIAAPPGTTAAFDAAGQRLRWTVGDAPPGTTLRLSYQVRVNPGAGGVAIRNSVTATGDVPPAACVVGSPCTVEHLTTRTPYVSKQLLGEPVLVAPGEWSVAYRIAVTNPDASATAPYDLFDTLGFAPGVEVRSATVTSAPPGVTLAVPTWDGATNSAMTTEASIPASATHSYDLTVRIFVPPGTPSSRLGCSTSPPGPDSGLYNSARLESLGATSTASACATVLVAVEAIHRWVINGQAVDEGAQPAGYTAQLTVNGVSGAWGARYNGYQPGTSVAVGASATAPANCLVSTAGQGTVPLLTALTTVVITTTVTCISLPATGWSGDRTLTSATWFGLFGAALVLIARRRRRRISPH